MGCVYRAYDPLLRRTVALKTLHKAPEDDKEVERFLREAATAATLDHPGIVQVYDVGPESRPFYIVMEFIPGTSFDVVMKQLDLDWERAAPLFEQIAKALDYAHSKNVVHLDVKPPKILVLPDNTIKISDFGIARFRNEALTSVFGTPKYASPEHFHASPDLLTGSADQNSLAVMVYELLTGKVPLEFDGLAVVEAFNKATSEEPVAPKMIRRDLPAAVSSAVMRALSKTAPDRFSSCREFIGAVESAFRIGREASPLVAKAEQDLEGGRHNSAVEVAEKAQALCPDDPSTELLVKRTTEARRDCAQALRVKGAELWKTGSPAGALEDLRLSQQYEPDSLESRRLIAMIEESQKRAEQERKEQESRRNTEQRLRKESTEEQARNGYKLLVAGLREAEEETRLLAYEAGRRTVERSAIHRCQCQRRDRSLYRGRMARCRTGYLGLRKSIPL